ncbi:MAG: VaFE repeat-containing surface-anchored protein [Clostridia bacterium]|nr:VaFE repeat-containing surface-anchored protein [Clostridia bacterium]
MTIHKRITGLLLGIMMIMLMILAPVMTLAEETGSMNEADGTAAAPKEEHAEASLPQEETTQEQVPEDDVKDEADSSLPQEENGEDGMLGVPVLKSAERDKSTWSVSRILQYAVNIPAPENGEDYYRMPHKSTAGAELSMVPFRVMDRALKAVNNDLAKGGLVDSEITYNQMDCSNFVGAFLDLYVGFSRYDLQYPRTENAPDINSRYLTTVYWYYRFWRDNDQRYTGRVIFVPEELRNNGKTDELEAWMKDHGLQRGDLILYASNTTKELHDREVNMGSFKNGHISIYWGDGQVMDSVSAGTDRGPAVNAFRASVWDSQTDPHKGSVFAFLRLTEERPVNGDLELKKTSELKELVENDPLYTLKGAVYEVTDEQGNKAGELVTGSDGNSNTIKGLREGKYFIKETKAPDGYLISGEVKEVTVVAEKTTTVKVSDRPVYEAPELLLQKVDREGEPEGNCTLSGAEFEFLFYPEYLEDQSSIPDKKPLRSFVMATDEEGRIYASDSCLVSGKPWRDEKGRIVFPLGTVLIHEVKAPEGYVISSEVKTVRIGEKDTARTYSAPVFSEDGIRGGFSVMKLDADTRSSSAQAGLSFRGTVIRVINDSGLPVNGKARGQTVLTAELDENGSFVSGAVLPCGDYILLEETAPAGYRRDENEYHFSVTEDEEVIELVLCDEVKRGGFRVIKKDSEELQPEGMKAGFVLVNRTGGQVTVEGSVYADGEVIAAFETDGEGNYISEEDFLPVGRYGIRETAAPEGYEIDVTEAPLTVEEGSISEVTVTDEPIRADIRLLKVDEDGNVKVRIPFLVEKLDEDGNAAEAHVMVTDEKGRIDTSAQPVEEDLMNILDGYVKDGVFTDEERLSGPYCIFFGFLNEENAGRGAFLYGRYRISELPVEDNLKNGEDLVTMEFEVDGKETGLDLGTIVDRKVRISSYVSEGTSGTKVFSPGPDTVLRDEISYSGLSLLHEYRIETDYVRVLDGSVLGTAVMDLVPDPKGTVTTEAEIDTSSVGEGETVVAVDRIYQKRGDSYVLIAVHECMEDRDQMLYTMKLGTEATDRTTGTHYGALADGKAVISDTVMYENLADGKTYRIEQTVYDRNSGEQMTAPFSSILRIDYSLEETVQDGYGSIGGRCGKVVLPDAVVEGFDISGRRLVVTEKLYDADTGELVYSHDDRNDDAQTVSYPLIRTLAHDGNGGKRLKADEYAVLHDRVYFSGFEEGSSVLIEGRVFDITEGRYLDITGRTYVTGNGIEEDEAEITFFLDSAGIGGHRLVVTETAYLMDEDRGYIKIAEHADLSDADQTVEAEERKTVPKTGDGSFIGIYAVTGTLSAALLAIAVMQYRKRKHAGI